MAGAFIVTDAGPGEQGGVPGCLHLVSRVDLVRRADRDCGAGVLAVGVGEVAQVVVVDPGPVDVTNIDVVRDLVDVLVDEASVGIGEERTGDRAPVLKLAGARILNLDAVPPAFPGLAEEAPTVQE